MTTIFTILSPLGTGTLATQSRVLRCLIPRTTVPLFVIFRALSSMRMLSNALRTVLFRWMVLVYDLVDRKDQLRVIYDGVLQYLGYDDLRASACQLLCYMTTRSHGGLKNNWGWGSAFYSYTDQMRHGISAYE